MWRGEAHGKRLARTSAPTSFRLSTKNKVSIFGVCAWVNSRCRNLFGLMFGPVCDATSGHRRRLFVSRHRRETRTSFRALRTNQGQEQHETRWATPSKRHIRRRTREASRASSLGCSFVPVCLRGSSLVAPLGLKLGTLSLRGERGLEKLDSAKRDLCMRVRRM